MVCRLAPAPEAGGACISAPLPQLPGGVAAGGVAACVECCNASCRTATHEGTVPQRCGLDIVCRLSRGTSHAYFQRPGLPCLWSNSLERSCVIHSKSRKPQKLKADGVSWCVPNHRACTCCQLYSALLEKTIMTIQYQHSAQFDMRSALRCVLLTWSSMQVMTPRGGSIRNASLERALCLVRAGPAPRPDPDAQLTRTSAPLAQGADEAGQSSSISLPRSRSMVACIRAAEVDTAMAVSQLECLM